MKNNTIIFAMFIIVINAKAQGTSSKIDSASIIRQRKNEIGINTTPLLSALIGSSLDINRFSITYKRILNDKSALRIAVIADKGFTSYSSVLPTSDTTINTHFYYDHLSPHINLGYERTFGKKKLKWFYGADLILGYSKESNSQLISKTYTDTVSGSMYMEVNPKTTMLNETKGYMVGLSPFFGAKYALSKRFSISTQVGMDATFKNLSSIAKDNNNVRKEKFYTFDLGGTAGFINDISIIYKF